MITLGMHRCPAPGTGTLYAPPWQPAHEPGGGHDDQADGTYAYGASLHSLPDNCRRDDAGQLLDPGRAMPTHDPATLSNHFITPNRQDHAPPARTLALRGPRATPVPHNGP